ncbi:MAG: magnetochrome domain-containing protein [Candidatus Omnitrophica bacterium]|nr:magnetochrome domain-containing protein [Candidatus Omnitrophota bacterium]
MVEKKRPLKKETFGGFNISLEDFGMRIKNTDLNTYFIFGAIILVLIVGLYAIFSPESHNVAQGNPACGHIVIAADGPSLRNNVAPTISDARYFLVVNPLTKKVMETVKNPYFGMQPDPQVVYLMAGKGEEAVIVGGIDQQSYSILNQFGIRVFGGYQGKIIDALKFYRQARISQSPVPGGGTAGAQNVPFCPTIQGQTGMGYQNGMGAQGGMANQAGFGLGLGQNCPMPFVNAGWGAMGNQDIATMGSVYPYCQNIIPGQGGAGTQAALAWQRQPENFICPVCNWRATILREGPTFPDCPNCNNPMALDMSGKSPNAVTVQAGAPTQVAFPWQKEGFLCPTCNWRSTGVRQNGVFPNCPNCGGSMALDINFRDKGQQWLGDGLWAATQAPATVPDVYTTQTTNAPNCFMCPNCKWKVYGVQGSNQYFRCPNCGQVGASGQQPQMTYQPVAQVIDQTVTPAQSAPPIPSNSRLPHAYRGVCTNCHQIMNSSAGSAPAQSGQSLTAVIPAGGNSTGTQQAQNAAQRAAFYNGGGCVIR